jgi:hypothetical protein
MSAALPIPTGPVCGRSTEPHMRSWRGLRSAEQGGPWVCGLCHPPARMLHVEWNDGSTEVVGQAASTPAPVIAAEAPAIDPPSGEAPAPAAEASAAPSAKPQPEQALFSPEQPLAPASEPASGELSLGSAIAKHGDAHLCEIEEEGWVVCPEGDCDRPDHDCRVQRAYALDAAADAA